ncbi:hypothetical protein Ga0466249_004311 [Sporomusaceae bacterium BoRhaA]|uniref:hypothetical protein n=1 Tax=Pelorhabdus rhamnosifermentans TaxID=2772457 RepID=UPI001C062547|nr:hypothetical protein [Pelorhabdus rhamnosifermentans]MBU2703175.1 hypothetical protein [Pelorhabdus rhamnosifermentans]
MTRNILPAQVKLMPKFPITKTMPSVNDFIIDTYQLLRDFFGTINENEKYFVTVRLPKLTESRHEFFINQFPNYCKKYGNIFTMKNATNEEISASLLKLYTLLVIRQTKDIHTLCKKLADVLNDQKGKDSIYISLSMLVPIGNEIAAIQFANNTIYSTLDINIHVDMPDDYIGIRVHQTDKDLLSKGKLRAKQNWLSEQLYKNISKKIELTSTNFITENGLTIVQSTITDPLMIFVLEMISNSQKFNICKFCGALTTDSRRYCKNTDCKQKWHSSNPIGKINSVLRQWLVRGKFDGAGKQYAQTIKDKVLEYGEKLIDEGYEHEEILPLLRKEKDRLLKKEV